MRSVLVAEDDAARRGFYRLWLEGEGYVVSEAADGREAIRLLETGPLPDAVADREDRHRQWHTAGRAGGECDPREALRPGGAADGASVSMDA